VLGLADQVGGDVHRVGARVGEHGDLGGAGLGVDPDQAAEQPLGRGDVDVARPGDDVDRLQHGPVGVDAAVREQRDALRPADRPHLLDAEQRGRREDRRVRQPAVARPAAARPRPASSTPATCAGTTFITTLDG
jgi:hypothetical protein